MVLYGRITGLARAELPAYLSAQYHHGALPADAEYAVFVEQPVELGRLLDCVAGVIAGG